MPNNHISMSIFLKQILFVKINTYLQQNPILNFGSLDLFFGSQMICMSTSFFTAVGSFGMQASIALPANHLIAIVLPSQYLKRRFDNSAPKVNKILIDICVELQSQVAVGYQCVHRQVCWCLTNIQQYGKKIFN
eukprot:TRINITY_DN8716_c0_g1_i2.p2 TRINITY_DN8716_c0_g1~~TRINITY_DN8716_c0_g1_i2.p2  ORF type:complete len:134 (+),score=3.27 TRINITY_DN8716_c0_g1_i2:62-463(+)